MINIKTLFVTIIILNINILFAQTFGQTSRLGVAIGESLENRDFVVPLYNLGVKQTHLNVWWGDIEPTQGNYNFSVIDTFLGVLPNDAFAIFRISARLNTWGNIDPPYNTVPTDLSVNGPFYDYVFNVVQRTNGRIKYFENEWEADCVSKHWTGTATEYAELSRTFYKAVKDADSSAIIIMGGSAAGSNNNGVIANCAVTFFNAVFVDLANDSEQKTFDVFDIHLYGELYDIPGRVDFFRTNLDNYAEFFGTPIIVTEYGGPSPEEFRYVNPQEYSDLTNIELVNDLCLLAGDLTNTPLYPNGYSDQFRMFAYGIDSSLDDKRDRIQGRQMVQRTILALSEGVEQLYWWSIAVGSGAQCPTGYYRHPIFGKMSLTLLQNNGSLIPNPTYYYYQTMANYLYEAQSVTKIPDVNTDIYLYKVLKIDSSIVYVVWEKRDQFDGENLPSIQFTFSVPWQTAIVQELFGNDSIMSVFYGDLTLQITDTPVFIKGTSITAIENKGIENQGIHFNQNYPNPFNSNTKISYYIPNSDIVAMQIYDLLGNVISTLVNDYQISGTYSVNFNAQNLSSGIYYYKLHVGNNFVETKIMILIR